MNFIGQFLFQLYCLQIAYWAGKMHGRPNQSKFIVHIPKWTRLRWQSPLNKYLLFIGICELQKGLPLKKKTPLIAEFIYISSILSFSGNSINLFVLVVLRAFVSTVFVFRYFVQRRMHSWYLPTKPSQHASKSRIKCLPAWNLPITFWHDTAFSLFIFRFSLALYSSPLLFLLRNGSVECFYCTGHFALNSGFKI